MKKKFKIGDKVKCIPGFTTKGTDRDDLYPGGGYKQGINKDVLTIKKFTDYHSKWPYKKGNIVWFNEISSGIFEMALEKQALYKIY